MKQTKTEQAKELFSSGKRIDAMKIFKTFKLGFTPDERRTIQIAYESQVGNRNFYTKLGIDTETVWKDAIQIIRNKYDL